MWDWNTPVEDYLVGMAEGVKVGKIRQIGIANCFAWQLQRLTQLQKKMDGRNLFPSESLQSYMREEEREMNVYAAEEI